MSVKTYQKYLNKVKTSAPLIVCLTNSVTVNDCANALLAIGASPIMSEDPSDVEALVKKAQALVINIGTINDWSEKTMLAAIKAAEPIGLPMVLDPVGAGASPRRLLASKEFLKSARVIRGNASEILALVADGAGGQKGVEKAAKANEEFIVEKAARLAQDHKAVVAVSGQADLITDGQRVIKIEGGTPLLTKLTGAGCLLTVMTAAYLGASPKDTLRATAAAHLHLAKAGEKAQNRLDRPMSLGTFKMALFDELALVEGSDLDGPMGAGLWRMDA
ncbi:MAG: hydroxyethylthiazole kinase [Deltaproteobacteria bacterium]|jgi:hydroxyethylthiazole kinase|nr:hydroxyethylthiazole kinase [Deltaproteobacteria bacterium]